MSLFSAKDFRKTELESVLKAVDKLEEKKKIIRRWQQSIETGKIYTLSETQIDVSFLNEFFGEVLGYEYQDANDWNLEIKAKTDTDGTKPDGVLGYFAVNQDKDVRVVIELKGANINLDKNQNRKDFKGSPVEQAFNYVPKYSEKCKWVIVSNFLEIRLYHRSTGLAKYETFEINRLLEPEQLAKFFFLLQKDRLFLGKQESRIDQFFAERRAEEAKISIEFYSTYKEVRENLFNHLQKENPEVTPSEIFQCTQKIIDRLIFICFVRDAIPMINALAKTREVTENLYYEKENKLWQALLHLFISFNEGYKTIIPHFNGGLFRIDSLLSDIRVKDFALFPLIDFILKYDFQSELNVNILGHIFEQSISDIEEIKRKFQTTSSEPTAETSKRKKDGIFYTPDYITQYIVKNSVGAWLEEKKEQLLVLHQTENLAYWNDYRSILLKIKILDPACGSGAFLVQVFEYLYKEWKILLEETRKLESNGKPQNGANLGAIFGGGNGNDNTKQEWEIKKSIVEHNIYGVDLNPESVEITKLALWLLTANRNTSLADLSDNIQQGNSLISDTTIAGNDAFDWQNRFLKVYKPEMFFDWKQTRLEAEKAQILERKTTIEQELARAKEFKLGIKYRYDIEDNLFFTEKALQDIDKWQAYYQNLAQNNPYEAQTGFDVIVGNPPYVRQELLGETNKKYFQQAYPLVYSGGTDLYVYFYAKAIDLLQNKGYLGYITPNKWFKTKYGEGLRKYLQNIDIQVIIDFFELPIFEDASTEPQIIILRNQASEVAFPYYPVKKNQDFLDNKIEPLITPRTNLNPSEWMFTQGLESQILDKLNQNTVSLNEYTKNGIKYGIKTGFNDAFIIDKPTKNQILKLDNRSKDIIKSYINPTNIKAYHLEEKNSFYLLNTNYDYEISESNYFGVYEHLKKFESQLIARQDKGKTYFNLRACDYYDKFDLPKIIYIRTAVNHYFYYDTEGYFVNDSCYIITNADKFLSIWLNSKIFQFYKKFKFVAFGDASERGRAKLDYNKMIEVPIPVLTATEKQPYETWFDQISLQSKALYSLQADFLDLLPSQYKPTKISQKLEKWYLLDFEQFSKEIDKQNPPQKLGKASFNDLRKFKQDFSQAQTEALALKTQIDTIEQNINQALYQWYGFTPEEIKVLENS